MNAAPLIWPPGDTAMTGRIRAFDWAATPLGPIPHWPLALRTALAFILGCPLPLVLGWGPDLITLYNDAYLPLLGAKPEALGQPFLEVWGEARDVIAPQVAQALAGTAVHLENAMFMLVRGAGPEQAFFDYSYSPVRDETGAVVGLLNTAMETTGRVLAERRRTEAEAALRQTEERFRALATAGANAIYRMSADWRLIYALDGQALANTAAPNERWTEKYILAEDLPQIRSAIDTAIKTKSLFEQEYRVRGADGAVSWVLSRAVPLLGPDGDITEWFGADSDVTERLRGRESQLQTLMDGVPLLVWRARANGDWTWSSPQWTAYTGLSQVESEGQGWLQAVHPDHREVALDGWMEAERSGHLEMDVLVRQVATGAYRWFQSRATPVRNDSGQIVEWLGISTDIDDLRKLRDRQQVLVGELQHRVRNILTVIRSVFSRTVERGGDLEYITGHFRGRLDALARTQVIVTKNADGLVDLEDLIRDELLSVGVSDGPAVLINGPTVMLPPRVAEPIGLTIHELTTNALKYGALRIAKAKLTIRWQIIKSYGSPPRLTLVWEEKGVPVVVSGEIREGFGRELIEEALPYRLGAETKLEFRGGGVRFEISLSLPASSAAGLEGFG